MKLNLSARFLMLALLCGSCVLNTPKEKRRVESSRDSLTPIPLRVPETPGWLEEQAEPEET